MTHQQLQTIDADTLLSTTLPPTRFIIDRLLPQGLHILAGAPKVGKSWLALWLCLQVAQGTSVWDFPTHRGTVLYLCLEDSLTRIQSRLFQITDDVPEALHFATIAAGIGEGLEEQLTNFLTQHPDTSLVVIDTLQRIRTGSDSGNPYANDYRDISVLKALADKHHIAILLIHHLRKMNDDDPMNMISGTTGISGATDSNFVLKERRRGSGEATLYCTGRDIEYRALVIDEAHKLPDAARQMYGQSLSAEDFRELCDLLAKEKYILAAQRLKEKFATLLGAMCRGELLEEAQRTAFILTPNREAALRDCLSLLRQLQKQLAPHLPRWLLYRLGTTEQALGLFFTSDRRYILYIQYDRDGSPSLCAASREMPEQLRRALWLKDIPAILTSGTLMAGSSFDRTRQLMGLSENNRLEDFIAVSPFNYEENCLLYIPDNLPKAQMGSEQEAKCLAEQICRLVEATHGHTLVLFTSYSLMGAVYNQVKDRLSFPLMEVWRHSQDMIHQFKQASNAVLFAAGSCWEGVDFPGDMVSSLIIVRLPFPVPDPLSEAEREQYPTLQDYIRAVIIPDMQVKLRQGFGRAIRTETDTCVVSILDHRAAPGQRYHQAVLETLPNLRLTRKIEDVWEAAEAQPEWA